MSSISAKKTIESTRAFNNRDKVKQSDIVSQNRIIPSTSDLHLGRKIAMNLRQPLSQLYERTIFACKTTHWMDTLYTLDTVDTDRSETQ